MDLDFSGAAAPTGNPEAEFLRDAVVDPTRPERLFAAVAQPRCLDQACSRAESAIRIYRSTDGGVEWIRQEVSSLGPYSLLNTRYADPGAVYVPRIRFAIAPSNPDVIVMAFRDEQIVRPRVYRSTNAGAQWSEISPPITSLTWPLAVAFSPADANTIYVGSSGVQRTTNGGATWSAMSPTHVDQTVLAFNAAGTLISGNDGGIYINTTGTSFAAMHGSLQITEFYSVSSHPSNGLLLAGGTQDNGTLIFQGNLGWSLITGGTAATPSSTRARRIGSCTRKSSGSSSAPTMCFNSSAARPAAAWLAPAASIAASPGRSSRAWGWTRRIRPRSG